MSKTYIKTLELRNFQKYKRAVFDFSESGNLIVGRNGSGKSTVVAAIVIALGGSSKTLGKTLPLHEYIRYGQQKAEIEVVICTESVEKLEKHLQTKLAKNNGKTEIRITRQITHGVCSYRVNGQSKTASEIKAMAAEININVESLTQCLPQDRVAEFSALTEEEQLETVIRACSAPLLEKKKELEIAYEGVSKAAKKMAGEKSKLEKMREELGALGEEAEKMKAYQARQDRIRLIHGKIKLMEYKIAREKHAQTKEAYGKIKDEHRQAEAELLQEEEKYLEKEKAVKKTAEKETQRIFQAGTFTEQVEEIKSLEKENQRIKNALEMIDEKKKRLGDEKIRIHAEERSRKDPPAPKNSFTEELKEELRKAEEDLKEEEIRDREWNMQALIKYREFRALELAVKEVAEKETFMLEKLKGYHKDTHSVVLALKESSKQWRVDLPAFLTLAVVREEFKEEVSSQITQQALTTFVCHDKEAFKEFVYEFKEKRRLAVNVIEKQPSTYAPQKQSRIDPKYEALYLSECVEAPAGVMEFLNIFSRLSQIPVTALRVNEEEFFREHPGITRAISNKRTIEIRRSRYTKDTPLVIYPIPKGVDLSNKKADEMLGQKLEKMKEERDAVVKEREATLRTRLSLQKKVRDLKEIKDASAAHEQACERNRKEAQFNRDRVAEIEESIKACEEDETAADKKSKDNKKQEKILFQKLSPLDFLQPLKSAVEHAKQTLAEKEALESMRSRVLERKSRSAALLDTRRKTKEQLRGNEAAAKSKLKEAEALVEINDRTKNLMKGLSSDREELIRTLEEEKAKQQLSIVDAEATFAYEEKKEDIEKLEEEVRSKETNEKKQADIQKKEEHALRKELNAMFDTLDANTKDTFGKMNIKAEVKIIYAESPRRWRMSLGVQFRESGDPESLSAGGQSGGEKCVSTILFLLSLQKYTQSPFVLVDEVNQGMDAARERGVHRILLGEDSGEKKQIIVITPKLVPGLEYSSSTKVHVVMELS